MKQALEQVSNSLPPEHSPSSGLAGSLPSHLRANFEWASGVDLGGVQVYRNSPEPAQYCASAFMRGNTIHLGPGEEDQLPHEAWHAVQQRQGRVSPTRRIGNVNLNDDQGLEREAVEMSYAVAGASQGRTWSEVAPSPLWPRPGGQRTFSSIPSIMQMSIKKGTPAPEDKKTPTKVIKEVTKLDPRKIHLPGKKVANDLERATAVEAIVNESTLRTGKRRDSGNLDLVTSMARAEHLILEGYDPRAEYNAGHLVADQLIASHNPPQDSFMLWNLAPQLAALNSPAYSGLAEDEVKSLAERGATIRVDVTVGYPADDPYKVTVADLVTNGIVDATDLDPNLPILKTECKIPRRIPNTWEMKATVQTTPAKTSKSTTTPQKSSKVANPKAKSLKVPPTKFPETSKPIGMGRVGEYFVEKLGTEPLTVAWPFEFTAFTGGNPPEKDASRVKLKEGQARVFEARQRQPTRNPTGEDIWSLLKTRFPGIELTKFIEILQDLEKLPVPLVVRTRNQTVVQTSATGKGATKLGAGNAPGNRKFVKVVNKKVPKAVRPPTPNKQKQTKVLPPLTPKKKTKQ